MTFHRTIGGRALLAGALPLAASAVVAAWFLWAAPPVDPEEARLAGIERTLMQKAQGRGNLGVAKKAAHRVAQSLEKAGADLRALSESPDLIGKNIDPRSQQKQIQDFVAAHPAVKWIQIVSDKGVAVAAAPAEAKEARPGSKVSEPEDFQALERAGGGLTRGRILPSKEGAEQNLLLGVEREGRRATLITRFRYSALLRDALDVPPGSLAFLVDTQTGKKFPYLAHTDAGRMGDRFNPQGDPQLVHAENDLSEGVAGYIDSYIEGKDRTVSFSPVPGWTLALGVVVEHVPEPLSGSRPAVPGVQDFLDLLRSPIVATPLLLILVVVFASPWVGQPASGPLRDLEARLKTAQEGDDDALMSSKFPDAKAILNRMRELLNKTREDFAQKLHEKETEAEELARKLQAEGSEDFPGDRQAAPSSVSPAQEQQVQERERELEALRVVVQTLRDENERFSALASSRPVEAAPPPPVLSPEATASLAVQAVTDLTNQARDLVDQVTGFAELVARDPDSLPEAQRKSFMETIHASEAGVRQFGSDISVYLESQTGQQVAEPLAFNKLFAECLAQVEGGAGLAVHVSDQEVRVRGMKADLKNAITNILLQASRDASRGAEVGVSLEVEDSGVTLTVADTGLILTEAQAAGLLDGYVNVEDIPPGVALSGLGLHLARQAVAAAGGALILAPRGAGGTDLVLRLPGEISGWAQAAPAADAAGADEVIGVEDETILAAVEEEVPASPPEEEPASIPAPQEEGEDVVEVVDLNPDGESLSAAPGTPQESVAVADLDLGDIPTFDPSVFEEAPKIKVASVAPGVSPDALPLGSQEFDPSAFDGPDLTAPPVMAAPVGRPAAEEGLDFSAFDEPQPLPNPPPKPHSDDNWPAPPGQGPLQSAFGEPKGPPPPISAPPPPPPPGGAATFDPKLWET